MKAQTINYLLEEKMWHYKVPAVGIAVVNNGRLDFAKTFGKNVDQNTLFQAGSISKTLHAFAILSLVKQGKVNLDEDVNHYLKRWQIKQNKYYTKTDKITLRQILSHSAGLNIAGFPGYAVDTKLPTLIEILNGDSGAANNKPIEVIHTPGKQFQYSGGGITVSQLLLEDVTSEDYATWMEKNILKPLGMDAATFKQPPPKKLQLQAATGHDLNGKAIAGKWRVYPEKAAAGLWTTPEDLAKFIIAMFNISEGGDHYPIDGKLQAEMLTKQIKRAENDFSGLGVLLHGENENFSFGHDGKNAGFIARMIAYQKLKKGFILMMNNDAVFHFMDEMTDALIEQYVAPALICTGKNHKLKL